MGRLVGFAERVRQSRLLAPNLKEATLHVYTGDAFKGNRVARDIVQDHLLALRWMNPNAVVYLREHRGQGPARIEYSLWTDGGAPRSFEIKPDVTAEEAVARLMMMARDPDDDVEAVAGAAAAAAGSAAGSGTGVAAGGSSAGSGAAAPSGKAPTGQQARAFSTVAAGRSRGAAVGGEAVEARLDSLEAGAGGAGRLSR